jgi:hypothetical protein
MVFARKSGRVRLQTERLNASRRTLARIAEINKQL